MHTDTMMDYIDCAAGPLPARRRVRHDRADDPGRRARPLRLGAAGRRRHRHEPQRRAVGLPQLRQRRHEVERRRQGPDPRPRPPERGLQRHVHLHDDPRGVALPRPGPPARHRSARRATRTARRATTTASPGRTTRRRHRRRTATSRRRTRSSTRSRSPGATCRTTSSGPARRWRRRAAPSPTRGMDIDRRAAARGRPSCVPSPSAKADEARPLLRDVPTSSTPPSPPSARGGPRPSTATSPSALEPGTSQVEKGTQTGTDAEVAAAGCNQPTGSGPAPVSVEGGIAPTAGVGPGSPPPHVDAPGTPPHTHGPGGEIQPLGRRRAGVLGPGVTVLGHGCPGRDGRRPPGRARPRRLRRVPPRPPAPARPGVLELGVVVDGLPSSTTPGSSGLELGPARASGFVGRPLRSPRAQARRQEARSGPVSDGVSPAWARRRAPYQSPVDSSARAAMAASTSAAKRRASSPSPHRIGAPKVTIVRAGRELLGALGEDAAGAGDVDRARPARRCARPARRRRPCGAGPSRRGERPPSGNSTRLQPSASSASAWPTLRRLTPGALDRDGVEGEGRRRRGHRVREEVVGGGADEHLVPPRLRERREDQGRVEVAVVVGGEDHRHDRRRRARRGRRGGRGPAAPAWRRRATVGRSSDSSSTTRGQPGRERAGPVGVVVGAVAVLAGGGSTPTGTVGAA